MWCSNIEIPSNKNFILKCRDVETAETRIGIGGYLYYSFLHSTVYRIAGIFRSENILIKYKSKYSLRRVCARAVAGNGIEGVLLSREREHDP